MVTAKMIQHAPWGIGRWNAGVLPVLLLVLANVASLPLLAAEGTASFTVGHNKLEVAVWLEGVGPYPFMLDLAAERPTMDAAVAAYLNLPKDPAARLEARDAANRPVAAHVVHVKAFQFAGLPPRGAAFVAADLTPFARLLGGAVAGVFSGRELGSELAINFERNQLVLRDNASAALVSANEPRVIRLQAGQSAGPVVSGLVDGKHVWPFAIDTTFGGVMGVPERALEETGLLTAETTRLSVANPTDRAITPTGQTQIRLESLRIGGAKMLEPVCALLESTDTPRIGLGFLKHFRVTLNFEKNLIRLEPTAPGPLKDPPVVGCGLTPAHYDGRHWTVWVAKQSPAGRAGLTSGGLLLEIDGKSMEGASGAEVSKGLEMKEGGHIEVAVLQSGETRSATLIAEKLL